VSVADMPESMVVRNAKDFTIYIPPFTSERRDRFTIAHELGHYFLHYRIPKLSKEVTFGRTGGTASETQANVFASNLLMPKSRFQKVHCEVNGDIWEL